MQTRIRSQVTPQLHLCALTSALTTPAFGIVVAPSAPNRTGGGVPTSWVAEPSLPIGMKLNQSDGSITGRVSALNEIGEPV